MEALNTANTAFALDVFKQFSKTQGNQNIFFSPWSIYSILTAVYLGAKGQTAEQIAEALHFNTAGGNETTSPKRKAGAYSKLEELLNNPCINISKFKAPLQRSSNIHSTFQVLSQEINQPTKHFLLRSVNQLYGDRSAPFHKEFLQSIKKYYNTEPETVNFQEDAEEVREDINSWVESQTEGKIQNLLSKGSIDALTQLILVNALYFKGNWSKPFKKEDTTEQPFRLNKSISKPVEMMFQNDKFNWTYIEEVQTEILELPYVNHDLSMFILLPDDINDDSTGLEMLEKELTYEALSKWTSPEKMEEADVKVYLPRIQLKDGYELKSTLSSLGITDAFSPGHADFTGMSERKDLVLSQVFHKCFLDVHEEGTEATASSAADIGGRSDGGAILFAVDHPFLFFIRHNKTKSILFLGRFCSP
ncbi:serpin B10-like [Tiliqua scincoides]|uniref:serpin B10-like n=1 Tax=Tiliqua scincoides TaxID=71010 RepID=UPI003462EB6C